MNWYKIFYWISVADKMSNILEALCIIFGIFTAVSLIGYFWSTSECSIAVAGGPVTPEKQNVNHNEWTIWKKTWRNQFFLWVIAFLIVTFGNIALPSKKDFLVIIAGGAVGNFITSDSSAKQIPGELTLLLREKLKSEIQDVTFTNKKDTLISKSKEELMEIIKNKK